MNFKIIGNWKMHPKTKKEALSLAEYVHDNLIPITGYEVGICPPSIHIPAVYEIVKLTSIKVGAQNIHSKLIGRHTGEISASMIKDYCDLVIVGHSERRKDYGENNKIVNEKVLTALDQNLSPIVCIGETLEDYRNGESDMIVEHLKETIRNVRREDIDKVIICYEPIWAISSEKGNNPADAEYANQMISLLRQGLAAIYNRDLAYKVPIIYGGSVDSDQILSYFNQPEINGVLVGSASLDREEFIKIAKLVNQAS
jgi:triosephosphate isomerase